jgi:hypothetical protein
MTRVDPLTLLALLAACLPLAAQPGPPAQTVVSTIAVRDAAGGSIRVRNNAGDTVTAFVYIYTMRSPDASVLYAATGYYDSAIDPQTQPPIKPGQEIHVPYPIPLGGATPLVGAEAGLFAGGGSFGEPHVVQSILDRRGYTLVALNKSIADLKQAAKDGLSRQDLISLFQTALVTEASDAGDSELANCIQMVRSQVVAGLFTAWRRPDGTPRPMPELIQSQVDALTQRRDALRATISK